MKEIELLDKRKEREKHFLQEDGTIIAKVYDKPVHFFKNGKYEEIDNTLLSKKDYFINKNNSFKAKFNKKDDYIIQINKDNYYINISLNQKKLKKIKKYNQKSKFLSKITYEEILDKIDIDYEVLTNKVKEGIILKDKKSNYNNIEFAIETNLILKPNNDGSINALNNNDIVFIIDTPYMIDDNKNVCTNIKYILDSKEKKYILKLKLDNEWLKDKNRKYPVIIDPTITNYTNENNVYDTYISSKEINTNMGNKDILKVGVEKINNDYITNRALLKFELPTLTTGDQVVDAKLRLVGYVSSNQYYDHDVINVHRITSDWSELTANWSINDSYDKRIEYSFESYRSNIINNNLDAAECCANITDLVKRWYVDLDNNGILLKSNKEEYVCREIPAFYSKDNSVIGDNPKPLLEISYRNQNGIESYMKYFSQEFINGESSVNSYNGNMTSIFNLISSNNPNLSMDLDLIYNTNDVILGKTYELFKGYKFNWYQYVSKIDNIDNSIYYQYCDADGTLHYFKSSKEILLDNMEIESVSEENVFYDEDNSNIILKVIDDGFQIIFENSLKYTFIGNDVISLLSKVEDYDGNSFIIQYNDNKIVKLKDNENEININYEENIVTISSSNKILTITKNNSLVNITNGIEIHHNENEIIDSIEDISGKKITFEYYEKLPYRTKKMKEIGRNGNLGSEFLFEYGLSTTTVNLNNKIITMTFNNFGSVVSTAFLKEKDKLKDAVGYTDFWGQNFQWKNKLTVANKQMEYVKNYILNSSFELDSIVFNKSSNDILLINSNEFANYGKKSLKITYSNSNDYIFNSFELPKEKNYTFSLYSKNDNDIKIEMYYTNTSNEEIREEKIIHSNNDFIRNNISIFYPENAISNLFIAVKNINSQVVYIDDIQLEEGDIVNCYNYIDNSDFSNGLNQWNVSNEECFSTFTLEDGTSALKISMDPEKEIELTRKLNISGKKGETYSLSFWYKNEGIFDNDEDIIFNNVTLNYNVPEDSEYEGSCSFISSSLNPNVETWQYFNETFLAENDFESMDLAFFQYCNANNLYITNIALYKDIPYTEYSYNENGKLSNLKDINDDESNFIYDAKNRLLQMTYMCGKSVQYEYDKNYQDRILRSILDNGNIIEYKYDLKGRNDTVRIIPNIYPKTLIDGNYNIRIKGTNDYLINRKDKLKIKNNTRNIQAWNIVKNGDYYTLNNGVINNKFLCNVNSNAMYKLPYLNNNLMELIRNDDYSYYIKDFNTKLYLKNEDGNFIFSELVENEEDNYKFYIEIIENLFIEANSKYDENYLEYTIDSILNKTNYEVIDSNNKIITTRNNKQYFKSTLDDDGNIIKKVINEREANYNYNNFDYISSIKSEGREYFINYDEFGNIEKISIGNQALFTSITDPKTKNLLEFHYGNNDIIKYEYDEFDRVKTEIRGEKVYIYEYDKFGNLAKIKNSENNLIYEYNLSNQINKFTTEDFTIDYLYDEQSKLNKKIYSLGNNKYTNEYEIDSNFKLLSMSNSDLNLYRNYDDVGRVSSKEINGHEIKYKYITLGKRTSSILNSIEFGNDKFDYSYHNNKICKILHNNKNYMKFKYNNYDELIEEVNHKENYKTNFKYNNYGNIIEKVTRRLSDNSIIEKKKYSYDNTWKDLLLTYDNQNIIYDNIGNPIQIGNEINLNWKNGKELVRYKDNINEIFFKYDVEGIRTSKIVNGVETKYYLENNNIIFEKTGNNILYFLREDKELIGFKYNSELYYYEKNIFNDIIGITDSNYNKIASYEYDAYGKLIKVYDADGNDISQNQSHIANINPFRYRSYYYDKETKLYYLNHRYYNPNWCRFINTDNILGHNADIRNLNLFTYCKNNPIMNVDANGNLAISLLGIVGAIVAITFAVVAIKLIQQTAEVLSHVLPSAVESVQTYAIPKVKEEVRELVLPISLPKPKKPEAKHTVYALVDENRRVKYIGRTVNVTATTNRHRNNPARKNLELVHLRDNLQYHEARILEEYYITYYKTLNKMDKRCNQIHGLRVSEKDYDAFMNFAEELSRETVYVGGGC